MLDLLIFAPCDKVIVAQGGQTSMIGVLEQIFVSLPKDKEIVAAAMIPYKWSILVLWHRTEEVPNPIQCKVKVVLLRPDGVQALRADAEFEINNQFTNFRQNVEIPLLPAGIVGEYPLTLSLKKGEEDWKEISTFPIRIDHQISEIEFKEVGTEVDNAEQT